jgi:hypothetical protein
MAISGGRASGLCHTDRFRRTPDSSCRGIKEKMFSAVCKQTFAHRSLWNSLSALPPKAGINWLNAQVRFGSKSRHGDATMRHPLYTQQRTLRERSDMSANRRHSSPLFGYRFYVKIIGCKYEKLYRKMRPIFLEKACHESRCYNPTLKV